VVRKYHNKTRCSLIGPHTAWCAVLTYAVLLTYLLLAPDPFWIFGSSSGAVKQVVGRTMTEYAQHVLAYAVFAWLLVWASRHAGRIGPMTCAAFALTHGIATEWLQGFVPYRDPNARDVVANVVGLGLGWGIAALVFGAFDKTTGKGTCPAPASASDRRNRSEGPTTNRGSQADSTTSHAACQSQRI
jgi:VanZ family protein